MMIKKILMVTKPFRYWLDKLTFNLSRNSEELQKLQNMVEGKPLLIVGNGPSLNKTPLDRFAGVPSIGMNKIDMIFTRTNWRPSMIITANNLVVRQHWESMIKNEIPCYLSWKSRWFLPRKKRSKFTFFQSNIGRDFQTNVTSSVGSAGTVTYTALQFAYYLGANPVIIVGVDHSFQTTGAANDLQKRIGDDNNHFDPNYFAEGQYWGVPNLDASEKGYLNAKEAFEADNRQVFDATVDGKLQVFKKITIDKAIALFER
jgi:hypothetical protein